MGRRRRCAKTSGPWLRSRPRRPPPAGVRLRGPPWDWPASPRLRGAQNSPSPLEAYDPLPDEPPALLSELFYAANEVPGIAELAPAAKRDLLNVVTERHKSRLANRAAEAQPERALGYLERLSQSELAQAFPGAMRQACAQHGLAEGPCAPHKGYVRRAQVLEEMLASQRLSLDGQEDLPGLLVARELGLVDNFLWANDFPHHEGSWPYSAQAIERTMGHLTDGERARILGLNAARIFKFDIPDRYLNHEDAQAVAEQVRSEK